MKTKLDCLKVINFIEHFFFSNRNKLALSQNFVEKLQSKKQRLLNKKILIAYSGGQDSSSLLAIFYILRDKWNVELGIVYCNHSWKTSEKNLSNIFEMLNKLKIPFYIVETPNLKPMQPEQKARNWRYHAFYEILKWGNYDYLLTGHTLSDSVETTLFHLTRGAGLKGVSSIKEDQIFQMSKMQKDFGFCKKRFYIRKAPFYSSFSSDMAFLQFSKKNRQLSFFNHLRKFQNQHVFLFIQNENRKQKWESVITFVDPLFSIFEKQKLKKTKNLLHRYFGPLFVWSFSLVSSSVTPYFLVYRQNLASSFLASATAKVGVSQKIVKVDANQSWRKLTTRPSRGVTEFTKTKFLTSWAFFDQKKFSKKNNFSNLTIEKLYRKKTKEKKQKTVSFSKPEVLKFSFFSEGKFQISSFPFKQTKKITFYSNYKKNNKWVPFLKNFPLNLKLFSVKTMILNYKKKKLKVLRPLIRVDRKTLTLFSKQLSLPLYYDKSNQNLQITRNYIRNILIPLFKKINPQFEKNIYKFSKISEFYYEKVGEIECPFERFDVFYW